MTRGVRAGVVLVLGALWLLPATSLAEESASARFARANGDFAAGRYAEAIAGFESILATDGYSAPLLFDLGNACFRAGRLGEAILWYERALLLDPRDGDVAANLRQARRAANLPLPEPEGLRRHASRASADVWAIGASALFFGAAIAAVGARLVRSRGPSREGARRALVLFSAGATILSAAAAALCFLRIAELDRAVVIGTDPALLVAPYEEATVSSELAPGELVRIEQSHQGFVLVRTASGSSGWIDAAAVARIVPDDGVWKTP